MEGSSCVNCLEKERAMRTLQSLMARNETFWECNLWVAFHLNESNYDVARSQGYWKLTVIYSYFVGEKCLACGVVLCIACGGPHAICRTCASGDWFWDAARVQTTSLQHLNPRNKLSRNEIWQSVGLADNYNFLAVHIGTGRLVSLLESRTIATGDDHHSATPRFAYVTTISLKRKRAFQ